MAASVMRCPQCDAPADEGRIFCRICGAALRPSMRLTRPTGGEASGPSKPSGVERHVLVLILKGLAGTTAVVAVLCPLNTFTEILVFVASLAVALICYVVLTNLDETHVDEYGKDGYWPKPLDWNAPRKPLGSPKEGPTDKV